MDITALFKLQYGLYVISSKDGDTMAGCVVNTLNQVTNSPIYMSVTLNKDNVTKQVIDRSQKFAAFAISESADMELIKIFGFKSSKDIDKFAQFPYALDSQGMPYVTEETVAHFSCKVIKEVDLDTHVMFIGELVESEILDKEACMTYAYYHQVKNGATPKNAPSYQATVKKSGWRCTVCGYIYEGDVLPEDYVCPLCGVPANMFEKIE